MPKPPQTHGRASTRNAREIAVVETPSGQDSLVKSAARVLELLSVFDDVKRDMPGLKGERVEALYRAGAAWLRGEKLGWPA